MRLIPDAGSRIHRGWFLNYYEHHIGDYDQATAHLSAVEDGIYSRMIRWYMASESPLPADIKAIIRRVRAHTADERAAVQTVLGEFFELRADGYHQQRCDDEVDRYKDKQGKAKRSANARWKKPDRTCSDDANAMRTHTERIEADGVAFGIGPWQQIDAAGRSVPWASYVGRVKAERLARNRETA